MQLLGGDGKNRIDNKLEIINYFLNNPSKSLEIIAKDLNICSQSLSKIIKDSGITIRSKRSLCKTVCQYTLEGILVNTFETARDAALSLGNISLNSHINSCCNNKRKTCKGYIWKWETAV